jgi:TRAP-type C4-dicarboxylate transport system substrate-binding protein
MKRAGLFALLWCATAAAQPRVQLRFAAAAPDGTAWARELRAFARDTELSTHGRVAIKWYFGAVAGDEIEALDRMKRGQLDGGAGASFCEHLAPSLRVTRVLGLLRDRREIRHVLMRLRPTIDKEFGIAGYVPLGIGSFGRVLLFSRQPIASLADLRKQRIWVWIADDIGAAMLTKMGVTVVRGPLSDAGHLYETGKHDGFSSAAIAALAFQWSARASYYSDLTIAMLPACITVTQRSFDAIAPLDREAMKAAAAKLAVRTEDQGAAQEEPLIDTLFPKQGLKLMRATPQFRTEFLEAARRARDDLGEQLPRELVERVLSWLGDLRAD